MGTAWFGPASAVLIIHTLLMGAIIAKLAHQNEHGERERARERERERARERERETRTQSESHPSRLCFAHFFLCFFFFFLGSFLVWFFSPRSKCCVCVYI